MLQCLFSERVSVSVFVVSSECFVEALEGADDWEWQDLMEWGGLKGGEEEEVRLGVD